MFVFWPELVSQVFYATFLPAFVYQSPSYILLLETDKKFEHRDETLVVSDWADGEDLDQVELDYELGQLRNRDAQVLAILGKAVHHLLKCGL